ncbi:MAG: hypothetical protein Q9220_005058 [cf. Caloplaca sp. 1 TL-2023]
MPLPSPSYPPLNLIIRFSPPSIPDLPLTIPSPETTNPLLLLHTQIRPSLPPPQRSAPLRLIHAGALLPASTPLSISLRLPPPPPPSSLKGKAPETIQRSAIYIHCALTPNSVLSPAALALEASSSASSLLPAPSPSSQQPSIINNNNEAPPTQPIGFDRLRTTASFTPLEITSLRSQFHAQIAHRHTPDSMPGPTALLQMEERWLDNSTSSSTTGTSSSGAANSVLPGTAAADAADDDDDDENSTGAMYDVLWGNLMGFFWPMGVMVWLLREEGVWSRRRQVAVVTGVMVNVGFGLMRLGGG